MNKKRIFYSGIFIIVSTLIITASLDVSFKQTNKWEDSNRIIGNIDGLDKTLNEAINEGLLINDGETFATIAELPLTPQIVGHNFNEIWISVKGMEMSLQEAIETKGLSGDLNFDGNYLNAPDPSHLATEIEISEGKSLQDSINNNEIIYTSKYYSQCNSANRYWYDSEDRQEGVREFCGEEGFIEGVETYCSGTTNYEIYDNIHRDYLAVDCTNDNCGGTAIESREIFECGGNAYYGGVGECSGGDCYGRDINPSAIYDSQCSVRKLPVDTCNGDQNNPFTCALTDNIQEGCTDIDHDGYCTLQGGGPYKGYWMNWYNSRTVYCFSTGTYYVIGPNPPPGPEPVFG